MINYEITGGLAIFQGNVEKVKECFITCQEPHPRRGGVLDKIYLYVINKVTVL